MQSAATIAPGLLVAALLMPPLAIYFAGGVSRDFWISLALTCLGILPGSLFSLWRLLDPPTPA